MISINSMCFLCKFCHLTHSRAVICLGFPANDSPERSKLILLLRKALAKVRENDAEHCEKPEIPFEQLANLEDLYTMPNSRFLQDIAYKRMMMPIPQSSELREFTLDRSRVAEVEQMATNTETHFITSETYATAVTMELVPIILDGRMFCPSTVLNRFMLRLWDLQYQDFVSTHSELYSIIAETAKEVFPLFETMPNELDLFAREAMEEMHSTLFNDTQLLTLAQELRDVANVSHRLYYNFLEYKSYPEMTIPSTNPFMQIMNDSLRQADVRCHTGDELFRQHGIAVLIFMDEWEDLEVEHVCHAIGEFAYMYIARRMDSMPGIDMEWAEHNLHWENLHMLCVWIKDFIHEGVFTALKYYNYIVEGKQTDEFLGLFYFLEPQERTVLEDVLMHLGWPPATPPSSSTPLPPFFPESTGNPIPPGAPEPTMPSRRRKPFGRSAARAARPHYYGNLPTGSPLRNAPPALYPYSAIRSAAIQDIARQKYDNEYFV